MPADRVFAIHNAVDGTIFRPDVPKAERVAMRDRLGIPADVPLIGCVARLSQWKDQASLLDALVTVRQSIPGVRLVLAGSSAGPAPDGQGNYKDYLVRRIVALHLDDAVTFAGFVPQSEMPAFYAALDVLAHPCCGGTIRARAGRGNGECSAGGGGWRRRGTRDHPATVLTVCSCRKSNRRLWPLRWCAC